MRAGRSLMPAAMLLAGALAAFVAAPLAAQDTTIPAGTRIPIPYRSYVAIDPLGIPFDIASAQFESAVAPGVTVGATASYTDISDTRYTTGDVEVRYYPGEVVLRGFSLGGSLGYTHFSSTNGVAPPLPSNGGTGGSTRATLDAPTLGVLVDYNWLLGTRKRFLVGTGVGAKRLLASASERDRLGLDRAYLTARFVVGLAF